MLLVTMLAVLVVELKVPSLVGAIGIFRLLLSRVISTKDDLDVSMLEGLPLPAPLMALTL